jgi:hypothetical protein
MWDNPASGVGEIRAVFNYEEANYNSCIQKPFNNSN